MLSPRWLKVLRDLLGSPGRTLLVVLSIAVGVAAVGTVQGMRENLSAQINASYAQVNPASASLMTEPFDDQLVRTVRAIPEVAAAEGRSVLSVQLRAGDREWREIQLNVIPDFDQMQINKVFPESGAWPPPERSLLVERSSLVLTGAREGDTVWVETPNGKQRAMQIAGLAHDLNEPAGTFVNQASGYISVDTLEWLGYPPTYNELLVVAAGTTGDQAGFRQVAELVRRKVEKSGREVYWTTVRDPTQHWFQAYLGPMTAILAVLGLLSLCLGCFLVVNTITALLAQQVRQVGMMKAIGARAGQLFGMYALLVSLFGVLGFLFAVPLGIIAGRACIQILVGIINFDPPVYSLTPSSLATQAGLSLLIPLLAGVFPILSGTRVTVREALAFTGMGAAHFGDGWVERLVARVQSLPRPLLLSLRNLFRKKTRLVLTLLTLTLGSMTFIAVLNVQSAMLNTLDATLRYFNFDLQIYFDRSYRMEQVMSEVLRVPGVEFAETWGMTNAHLRRPDGTESENIFLAAPPEDTRTIQPRLIQGRWLLPEDENAVVINTDVVRLNPGLAVGSTLQLLADGKETTWTVVGVAQSVMIGPWAYANYPYYAYLLNRVGLSQAVYVVASDHDSDAVRETGRRLTQHLEQVGLRVRSTALVDDLRQTAVLQFNVVLLFLVMMAVIIALVGCLGLMGTMSLNVMERTREIGVIRAIGGRNGSILQIFISEGVLIGMISWLAGALLAWPFGRLLSGVVGMSFIQAPLEARYSFAGAGLWLAILLALSALASLIPALHAARVTVRDALAYE